MELQILCTCARDLSCDWPCITGFLVIVNNVRWEVNKVPVGTLFGTLRWVGADTSLPQHSESKPSGLVSDLEVGGHKICEELSSDWKL